MIEKQELVITYADVDKCSDIDVLLKWKLDVDDHNSHAERQITRAKASLQSEGEYADPEWFSRVTYYKRRLGQLSQRIQNRIRELRPKAPNAGIQNHFMDVARLYLSPDMFKTILDQAKIRSLKQQNP